uniref:thiol oxidase n=1 Tax=viral metagenome TaxID=1070528 RepID=A0A6C0DWK0_9ZZZZ
MKKTYKETHKKTHKKTVKSANNKQKKEFVYNKTDYNSGDGMLTNVWGPSLWHYLHVMSFNYPLEPTNQQKQKYKQLLLNLQYTLPCKYCRINLKNNFKKYPLIDKIFQNRYNFSYYIFSLHEHINKMLGKKSGLTYCEVRDNYEHFRSRCTVEKKELFNYAKNKPEKGCTTPMYGKKSKCVINIVPQETKCKTFNIDKKCLKTKD